MKRFSFKKPEIHISKPNFSSMKQSAVSLVTILLVASCLVVVNLIVSTLPSSWLSIDTSDSKVTHVSDEAKAILKDVDTEIELIVVSDEENVDDRIRIFLKNVTEINELIHVEYMDPIVHPSVLTEYGTYENTIVVKCPELDKTEVIFFEDIILYDSYYYYYYGSYVETEFDGEGQLISAINSVTTEASHHIYMTSGHQESSLSSTIEDLIDKNGLSVESVNLLMEGQVPLNCELLILNAPVSDLADDELTMIEEYLGYGDVLILLSSSVVTAEEQPNMAKLLKEYNIVLEAGYAADLERFYQNNYYAIFPELSSSHSYTSSISSDELVLLTYARGLSVTEENETVSTDVFMTTSSHGALTTESAMTEGEIILGVTAQDTLEETTGRLTVISAESLISSDITDRFSNVANAEVFMNVVTDGFEDVSNVSIASKSLEITYNTVMAPALYSSIFLAVIPLGLLVWGVVIWMRRRKA